MKKWFLSMVSLFLFLGVNTYATDSQLEQVNKCLGLLKTQVQYKYGIDISNVTVNGTDANLAEYSNINGDTIKRFKDVLKENTSTKGCQYTLGYSKMYCKSHFSKVFFAKRNNISTVMVTPDKEGKGYWTATEFVTWGGNVGFQFPLRKRDDPQFKDYDYYVEGDDYGKLKENMVYVQYLKDGTLLSCGFIKFTAGSTHTLNDLFQANYKGNAFEGGGFEKINKWNKDGDIFFGMKVKIRGLDWDDKTLFYLNLIGIAYNNNHNLFNEYISYPLQIKAMTNIAKQSGSHSMNEVMDKYRDYLINNTCFKLIHDSKSQLPGFCGGDYKSESNLVSYNNTKNYIKKVVDLLIPKVYAFEVLPEEKKREINNEKMPLPTVNGVDIYTMRKINNLKDEILKNRLLTILSPAYKVDLEKRKKDGTISYDELVYLNCNINHTKLVKNIEYIFSKYYNNGSIDFSNIEYIDPEFGDCVIPYPDKRHKNKFIKNSFIKNKLSYIKNKFGEEKMEKYEDTIRNIQANYFDKISQAKKQYSEALFEKNKEKAKKAKEEIETLYKEMDNDIIKYENENQDFKEYVETKKQVLKDIPNQELKKNNKNNKNYSIYFIILGVILVIIALALISNKKKND